MLLTISVTVIAAIMVVAMLFLIPILMQMRRTAREVEKILETARMQVFPLSHDLIVISQEVKGILQSIHRQVDRVEESITTVRNTAIRLGEFEKIISPLLKFTTLAIAVSRGVEAFVRIFRR